MRFSIQSKMIVGVLLVSLLAASITGYLGYRSGHEALMKSIYDRLIAIRHLKATHLERFIVFSKHQVQSFSEDLMVIDATKEFRSAVEKLKTKKLSPNEEAELQKFYKEICLPELAKHYDTTPVLNSIMPPPGLSHYLQYHYIAKNPNPIYKKSLLMDAQDGSEYSQVHLKYHGIINNFKNLFEYDDVMIVDAESAEVIYTANKEIELGTDFDTGPYSRTSVAEAIRDLQRDRDKDSVILVDFEQYRPSFGKPAAFALSPIFDGMEMIGILVTQFPINRINRFVSGGDKWEEDGLGKTGEIYLIGEDGYMRNESRFFKEDPKKYLSRLTRIGSSKEEVAKTERLHSTILTVKLKSKAIERIFQGQSGTEILIDYLGEENLISYAPLQIPGLRWGIVAKITTEEAFAPVRKFTHDLLTALAGIGLGSSIVAAMMGSRFARPVRQLIRASHALGKGNYAAKVKIDTRDEFADLGNTFNSMASELHSQNLKIHEKIQENERLLESMLPTQVAARLRSGPKEQTSDSHSDVSILFGKVSGFDTFSEGLEAARSLELLNRLIISFDEAAERHGVEKLKSIGASYLAVCGLSVPRFDHSQRAVAFAIEMQRIIESFNQEYHSQLELNAGVHCGPVTGGIIGRSKFIYDLWGRTVNIARNLGESGGGGVIRITKEVYERVADLCNCELVRNSSEKGDYVYLVEASVGS